MKPFRCLAASLALLVAVACSNGTGPSTQLNNVQISFATTNAGQPAVSGLLAAGAGGVDELVLSSVRVVLREVELKRVETVDCDTEPEPEGCEEFEAGPFLISLPLDGTVRVAFDLDIPQGQYDRVDFEVHKVSDDPGDEAFLLANPEFEDLSIVVTGTFNGAAFRFETDLDVEQENRLDPPLEVTGEGLINVTVEVDVATWFVDETGALVDPATGNKGGVNEGLIKDNIKDSFRAFEDGDKDGDAG